LKEAVGWGGGGGEKRTHRQNWPIAGEKPVKRKGSLGQPVDKKFQQTEPKRFPVIARATECGKAKRMGEKKHGPPKSRVRAPSRNTGGTLSKKKKKKSKKRNWRCRQQILGTDGLQSTRPRIKRFRDAENHDWAN